MQVVHDHRLATWSGAAVTIGNFDGVHVGHRALTSRAIEPARAGNLTAVALTFEPHPAAVLGQRAPARLSSAARKLELLADAGLDATVVEPFTRELAALTPEAFLDQVLLGALRARAIVVGYDFNYGCARAGTIDTLRAHGARAGIEIAVVSPVEVDGTVASSSKIRSCLGAGTLADATRLLGRAWDVDGVVVHGAKRGRAIGIPTANIAPDSDLPLAPGIYAVTLAVEGGPPLPAVASLGTNPDIRRGRSPGPRGPRARLGWRPLRSPRAHDVRRADPRRAQVHDGRGAGRADSRRHRARPRAATVNRPDHFVELRLTDDQESAYCFNAWDLCGLHGMRQW
ncbi:MAG: bifunctional riboflavin kinase/FMN adenylyltransferase [Candidatus Limnocylindrales bacterium]